MRRVDFVVIGEPVGKQRPIVARGHAFTPKKTAEYEDFVRLCYNSQVRDKTPLQGYIKADIKIYMGVPKSASKSSKKAMYEGIIRPTKTPDIDNVTKAILDALNEVAYKDDSSVVYLTASKHFVKAEDDSPRVEVTLVGD